MDDLILRLLVIAAAVLAGLGIAWMARLARARRAERAPLDLNGVAGRVVLLSEASCSRCDVVRQGLDDLGSTFSEVRYEDDPERFRRIGGTAVPMLIVRGRGGEEIRRVGGVPTVRRLRRLLVAVD